MLTREILFLCYCAKGSLCFTEKRGEHVFPLFTWARLRAASISDAGILTLTNIIANGRSLSTMGGTNVIGQVGPAVFSAYTFAESYTNMNFDGWLRFLAKSLLFFSLN